jgi:hypothetical protein
MVLELPIGTAAVLVGDAPSGDDDWRRCICTCICTLLGFDEGNDTADSYELGR